MSWACRVIHKQATQGSVSRYIRVVSATTTDSDSSCFARTNLALVKHWEVKQNARTAEGPAQYESTSSLEAWPEVIGGVGSWLLISKIAGSPTGGR